MRDVPSTDLLELLERLRLLAPAQVRSVARQVRKLAGNLPQFDSVWVDALAKARRLTAYQAREIKAGRGEQLAIGPFLVSHRLPSLGYAEAFVVRSTERQARGRTKKPRELMLLAAHIDPLQSDEVRERIAKLMQLSKSIVLSNTCPIRKFGVDGDQLWVVADRIEGVRAADWISENGRFPPLVVLHVARQMLVGLCELERIGLWHGDLHVRNLIVSREGDVTMLAPGVRPALRPHEGFSMVDLPPEGYETLAPERVTKGESPSIASELFACGCVWWQMLTGRPAIAGGNALAKLKAVAEARIPDVRQLAPDAPPILAEVIAACTSATSDKRPRSFAELARLLGPPSELGTKAVARCLSRPERWLLPRPRSQRKRGRLAQHALEVATVAACILVTLAAWRMMVRPGSISTGAAIVKSSPSREPSTIRPPETVPPKQVRPARFVEPRPAPIDKLPTQPEPLRLPVDRVVRLKSLTPAAGQIVCGENDGRPTVLVPRGGLLIEQPDVRFQDVDFVADESESSAAMILLRTPTARFERCTFRGGLGDIPKRTAIGWLPPTTSEDVWDAAVDHVSLVNCVFHAVEAALDRSRVGEATVECVNVLHVASGPMVRTPLPASDAPLTLTMDHCTLRSTGPVVDIGLARASSVRSGRVTVSAVDCVLAPRAEHALIELATSEAAQSFRMVRWLGKDSLLEVSAPLIASREPDSLDAMDESQFNATGIARSQLDFAGEQLETPAASHLRRWLAPRQSLTPPGIVPEDLPNFGSGNTANLTSDGRDLGLQ